MLNRWIEESLLDTLGDLGVGCIAFSPLAQGMLTDRYLKGIPADSRAAAGQVVVARAADRESLKHIRALNRMAKARGQSLAQMALAWALRDERMTSLVIGASSVAQLENNVAALDNLSFTDAELTAIDRHAVEAGINLWQGSSDCVTRPGSDLLDPGWAQALEPVAGQISAMGEFLRAELAAGHRYLPAGA